MREWRRTSLSLWPVPSIELSLFLHFCSRSVCVCVVTRLAQGGVGGKTRWIGHSESVLLRGLRRFTAAGNAGDGSRNRSQRVLWRVPMLHRASRWAPSLRPREAPDADAWHLRSLRARQDERSGSTCRRSNRKCSFDGADRAGQGADVSQCLPVRHHAQQCNKLIGGSRAFRGRFSRWWSNAFERREQPTTN